MSGLVFASSSPPSPPSHPLPYPYCSPAIVAAIFALLANGKICKTYTKGSRPLSDPVKMISISTNENTTTYENIHVKGSVFPKGALVVDLYTGIIPHHPAYRYYFGLTLNTTSTKASFVGILSFYYGSLSTGGSTVRDRVSYWINSNDTCQATQYGLFYQELELQAVQKQ